MARAATPAPCGQRPDERLDLGIGRRLARLVVAIPAGAALLSEPAHRHQPLVDQRPPLARVAEVAERLAHARADVEAGHVVHREHAHRHAEVRQRAVHLRRRRPLLDEELRLVHVREHQPVAHEARAVADDDPELAHALREGQRRHQHVEAGARSAHDLEQPHDRRRAEEMQADHRLGTRRGAGDRSMSSVDVLVARMQPGLAIASISRKTRCLSARSSKTASITDPRPRRAGERPSTASGGCAPAARRPRRA